MVKYDGPWNIVWVPLQLLANYSCLNTSQSDYYLSGTAVHTAHMCPLRRPLQYGPRDLRPENSGRGFHSQSMAANTERAPDVTPPPPHPPESQAMYLGTVAKQLGSAVFFGVSSILIITVNKTVLTSYGWDNGPCSPWQPEA